jgi:hypothetical protein
MRRRDFLKALACSAVAALGAADASYAARRSLLQVAGTAGTPAPTLLTAPIELAGNWDNMRPDASRRVVERMRRACLEGVRLLSDRQPAGLRIEQHAFGPPAVWLHTEDTTTAWVIVHFGERAWAQLAYQFGHELGHVVANSWQANAKPALPCQWVEEALVEAFSIHGLGHLAASWKADPPFPDDNAFGEAIARYRRNLIRKYSTRAEEDGALRDPARWLTGNRSKLEAFGHPLMGPSAILVLAEYERAPACVEALGALNRWPERSGLPIGDYFRKWRASCNEIGASAELPNRLRDKLGIAA